MYEQVIALSYEQGSDGGYNFGGLSIAIQIFERGRADVVTSLVSQKITGSRLWFLWKDVCEEDWDKFFSLIDSGKALETMQADEHYYDATST